ncbi:MAG: hypothetical protein RIU71_2347, partial [Pseudomonadota bacterium]
MPFTFVSARRNALFSAALFAAQMLTPVHAQTAAADSNFP